MRPIDLHQVADDERAVGENQDAGDDVGQGVLGREADRQPGNAQRG
jgi:hypothetical protein